jgi:hypothetical protein
MLPIQKLFSSNERFLNINFEGIAHEDSLKEMYKGNSANLILGQLSYSRKAISSPLGLPTIGSEKMKEVYASGVIRPDMSKAVRLDMLKKKVKEENLLEQLTFLGFHETYHLGQIGLIRKLPGKEDAIK